MHRLICQKLAHFLFAQMALVSSTFFQMFIVLGMYNFALEAMGQMQRTVIRFWYVVWPGRARANKHRI